MKKGQALDLRTRLKKYSPEEPVLPLTHGALSEEIIEICKKGRVKTHDCDVYKRSLAYFFYGRPAYRPKKKRDDSLGKVGPVVGAYIFLSPNGIGSLIERVCICDSGAVYTGRLKPHICENMLDDIDAGKNMHCARKCVAMLFRTHKKYMLQEFEEDKAFTEGSVEQKIYGIGTGKLTTETSVDDRVATVEVQMHDDVPLSNSLVCMAIPRELRGVDEVAAMYDKCTAKPIVYSTLESQEVGFQEKLLKLVVERYKNAGWLS